MNCVLTLACSFILRGLTIEPRQKCKQILGSAQKDLKSFECNLPVSHDTNYLKLIFPHKFGHFDAITNFLMTCIAKKIILPFQRF